MSNFVIEFRSGSLLQNLQSNNGGARATAQVFSTRNEAEAFMRRHDWILFNGGAVISSDRSAK